jgi:hypothetical protein
MGKEKRSLYCPRCKNTEIIEYDETFDCPKCKLEFYKRSLSEFDDEDILSIEELSGFKDGIKKD